METVNAIQEVGRRNDLKNLFKQIVKTCMGSKCVVPDLCFLYTKLSSARLKTIKKSNRIQSYRACEKYYD